MSLIPYEPLDETRLDEICRQRTAESQTLDFKRALPGMSNADKSEFLKDVCAFANKEGGDLVYGVVDDDGTATALSPIAGEAPDSAKRRLGQIADAGLEPRVVGLQFKEIMVPNGYVLVVRVPESYNGPHRYGQNGRFVMRSGTHTTELTYDQLRNAFDRGATLAERARHFQVERLALIRAMKVGKGLTSGPKALIHIVPISAIAGRTNLDVHRLYQHPSYAEFMFPDWGGGIGRATNLDGLLVYADEQPGPGIHSYVQVFRSGILEAGRSVASKGTNLVIPAGVVTRFFRDVTEKLLKDARRIGLSGPAILGAALLSIGEYQFGLNPERGIQRARADRNDLVFPEVWIEQLESERDVDAEIARPMLDMLWQAFDLERCLDYDEKGNWRPGR